MNNTWIIVGQIGTIVERKNCWMVSIADNKYNTKTSNKESTVWFNCISNFKPNVKVGDKVIANGNFVESKNENFPFAMMISYIGTINKE